MKLRQVCPIGTSLAACSLDKARDLQAKILLDWGKQVVVVKKLALIAACITAILMSAVFCSASEWTGLDQVAEALLQPDGTQVQLSPMFVDSILGDYIVVRDLTAGSVPIPVYIGVADVSLFSTVSISGRLATVVSQSRRVLIADGISMYTMSDGRPSPPAPWLDTGTWPYLYELPISMAPANGSALPAVPNPPTATAAPISAPEGSVIEAKTHVATNLGGVQTMSIPKDSGSVQLEGKIATAVFFSPGTNTVSFFYLQETDAQGNGILGGQGIKVVPQSAVQVEAGELVNVTGTVVGTSSSIAECYIDAEAEDITHAGWGNFPKPVGMPQRSMAGGEIGSQCALYLDTTSGYEKQGYGLNPAGTLIVGFGLETDTYQQGGHNIFYLDDGSALKPDTSYTGLKVVSWEGVVSPATVGTDYYRATGILGAEIANSLPVPVLRIPSPHLSVSITTPPGNELSLAYGATSVVISGLAAAPGTGVASVQVKIGSGDYDDVDSYDPATHIWTYTWTSPSNNTIYAKVTDTWGSSLETNPGKSVTITPNVGVVYVRPPSTRTENGQSWETAYSSVNTAITNANTYNPKREVWVAAGTYLGTNGRCTLLSNIAMYGGFSGDETAREQRNWGTNQTTLDGQAGGVVVTINSVTNCRIDGFTVRNGRSTYGGGIYCNSSTATITHNIIMSNTATGSGGGVYSSGSSPMIANNWIVGNATDCSDGSDNGGGVYCRNTSAPVPTIVNNTIACNSASNGGAIYISSTAGPIIVNNIVASNTSGIYVADSATMTIDHNVLWGRKCGYAYQGSTAQTKYWEPNAGDPDSDGNICLNPGFVDSDHGNFSIRGDSPCINSGSSVVTPPDYFDIDGTCRADGHIDIGADEWNGTSPVVTAYSIIRVSPDGSDSDPSHDGSSWGLAKATIQSAIDTAYAKGSAEVWVMGASGAGVTYNEAITLRPFVHVYGGFDAQDLERHTRDWKTNVTIIDGTGKASSVVRAVGIGYLASTLDGFTVQNGNTTSGGGIYCSHASPRIAHNKIINNTATGTLAGGGIYCLWSSPWIANNYISGNHADSGSGGGILCNASRCDIVNNTIMSNIINSTGKGGGIYIYDQGMCSQTRVENNIVASNSRLGISVDAMSHAAILRYNNVWNQSSNYGGVTDQNGSNGNICVEPINNACKDKGINSAAERDFDIDGDYRIQDGTVDIGADEVNGNVWEVIELSSESASYELETPVTIKIRVYNPQTQQPVVGRHVDLSLSSGEITDIEPAGSIGTPSTGGWGETGSDGCVTLTLVAHVAKRILVTASMTNSQNVQVAGNTEIMAGHPVFNVGFLYSLCRPNMERAMVDSYLSRIDSRYSEVSCSHIADPIVSIDSSYNTVFVVLPIRSFSDAEKSVMKSFVESGRDKRLVLVGEFPYSGWNPCNTALSALASYLGMMTGFYDSGYLNYDSSAYRGRQCQINTSHYLTYGMSYLWDGACYELLNWDPYAQPIAYANQSPTSPYIVEEDTTSTGSRVAIADCTGAFGYEFTVDYDPYDYGSPDKNVRFIYNLCTVFRE